MRAIALLGLAALAMAQPGTAQDDEAQGSPPQPEEVARELTITSGTLVRARDIRALACVGSNGRTDLANRFSCQWEQQQGRQWVRRRETFVNHDLAGTRLHVRREWQDWWPDAEQVAAALSRHNSAQVDPAAVDDVSCQGAADQQTAITCQWLQDGAERRWQEEAWHGRFVRQGTGWSLIDAHFQHFAPTRIDRIDGYHMNGATVLLHGLLRCGAFGCWISGNRSALGIAGRPGPETVLSRLAGRLVYLKAIVTDECARSICVDQAPALHLVAVSARPFAQMTAARARPD